MTVHDTPKAIKARVPPASRPATPAHIIKTDAEAIEIAHKLAAELAKGASAGDRGRIWPKHELDAFSQSGLWSINVPKEYGGPGLSDVTLNRAIAIISEADPSLGQMPQNLLGVVAAINTVSDPAQRALLFSEVLKGTRFGNAFSEFGSKRVADFETKFTDHGDYVTVTGRKFYCAGASGADCCPR